MSGTFMDKSFSVAVGGDQAYRDNHDRIFKKKPICSKHHLPMEIGQCPYSQEINNENVECECCPECQQQCLDDI